MNSVINNMETVLIRWANPEALDVRLPAQEDWLLHRLDQTLLVLMGYLLFVLFGFLFLNNGNKSTKRAPKGKLSVGEKWAKEPFIFPAMVLYNATQVILCGYMVSEAFNGKQDRELG